MMTLMKDVREKLNMLGEVNTLSCLIGLRWLLLEDFLILISWMFEML